MSSLSELYQQMVSVDEDIEKTAEYDAVSEMFENNVPEESMKIAAEYDAAGRIMARAYFDEMLKAAAEEMDDEENKDEDEDEKKKKEDAKKKGLPPGLASALAEKKASIMDRMQQDPAYAQELFNRYYSGE